MKYTNWYLFKFHVQENTASRFTMMSFQMFFAQPKEVFQAHIETGIGKL
jgi:hypothetical protein